MWLDGKKKHKSGFALLHILNSNEGSYKYHKYQIRFIKK